MPACVVFFFLFLLFLLVKILKQKLQQMGALIEERFSKRVTHILAMDSDSLLHLLDTDRLSRFKGVSPFFLLLLLLKSIFFGRLRKQNRLLNVNINVVIAAPEGE